MTKYKIFTDGGARGNPGPAAIGVVMVAPSGSVVKKHGEYVGDCTNNQAEYKALLWAVRELIAMNAGSAEFYLDSELVVRQMQGKYKIKEPGLQVLAMEVLKGLNQIPSYRFIHIPREKNQDADRLVNDTLDRHKKNQV